MSRIVMVRRDTIPPSFSFAVFIQLSRPYYNQSSPLYTYIASIVKARKQFGYRSVHSLAWTVLLSRNRWATESFDVLNAQDEYLVYSRGSVVVCVSNMGSSGNTQVGIQ